jgi:hypothetical protein
MTRGYYTQHEKKMKTSATASHGRDEKQILRCYENGSPPQREEGQGVVGGSVSVSGNHP